MHGFCQYCHGDPMYSCTCGLLHDQPNTFSMLRLMPHHHNYEAETYPFSSPSSVDCTLSLGTPSTRLCEEDEKRSGRVSRAGSYVSKLCRDFLHPKKMPSVSSNPKNSRGSGSTSNGNNNLNYSDPLLARRCANCDTTSTPLWRNGPKGPKSLCNACGIRFKKEERRATATNMMTVVASESDYQHYSYQSNSWQQTQKMPYFSPSSHEYRFMDDSAEDSDSTMNPVMPWRLNLSDVPSFVQEFTR